MKKKELAELRQKNTDELSKMLVEKKKELAKLSLDASTLKLKNTASLKTVKADISRILTLSSEKELAAAINNLIKEKGVKEAIAAK